jgi:iron complex outermembrane receptor protein
MRLRRRHPAPLAFWATLAICVSLCLSPVPAGAQEEADDDTALADDLQDEEVDAPDVEFDADELEPAIGGAPSEGVEEIMVTGEVLESTTQAETTAITTFAQEELDTLGITDIDSLALNTPSLHVGQVGDSAVITLRGIGLENLTSVGEPGVGFAVDGVHLGRPSAANSIFFDLERVDVLRGPQGTQGGRNTNGGRIALWSKKPDEELNFFGDMQYGSYDQYLVRAVANIPVYEDLLMTRSSVIWEQRDGYQKNRFYGRERDNTDDTKDWAGRWQIRSMLFDQQLELRGIGTFAKQRGRGPASKLIGPLPTDLETTVGTLEVRDPTGALLDPFLINCPRPLSSVPPPPNGALGPNTCANGNPVAVNSNDPRESYADVKNNRNNRQEGGTGLLNWDMPFWSDGSLSDMRFAMVGSWQRNKTDSTTDFDGTNIPSQRFDLARDAEQRSVEFYFERPDVDWWDYKTGFFYYHEKIDSELCFDSRGTSLQVDVNSLTEVTTTSYAGYGEIAVRPVENLRIQGGVRYTNEKKRVFQLNRRFEPGRPNAPGEMLVPPGGCGRRIIDEVGVRANVTSGGLNQFPPIKTDDTFAGWTPRFNIEWQVSDTSSLGFSATRGFKSGGFPLGVEENLTPDLQDSYNSEKVWSYELTSKNVLFDGLLTLNLTGFWTEYDPFQICQFSGPLFFCRSDGSATIRGIEIEFFADPIEGLQINGFFNYLDSRVNDFQIIDPSERECPVNNPNCVNPQPSAIPTPTDVSGNELPKAPEWQGALGIQYTLDMGRFGFLTPRFQTQYSGKTYFRVFNKNEFAQGDYIKFDAKLSWRSDDDRFFAETFITNITDKDVINSEIVGPQFTGGQVLGQYQPPRTWGFRVGITHTAGWF